MTVRRPGNPVPPEEVERHLQLVHWVISHRVPNHVFYRATRDDMFQAGVIGLMNAIRLFDPAKGNRFSTFAVHKIRWNILIEAGLTRHGWEAIAELPSWAA